MYAIVRQGLFERWAMGKGYVWLDAWYVVHDGRLQYPPATLQEQRARLRREGVEFIVES